MNLRTSAASARQFRHIRRPGNSGFYVHPAHADSRAARRGFADWPFLLAALPEARSAPVLKLASAGSVFKIIVPLPDRLHHIAAHIAAVEGAEPAVLSSILDSFDRLPQTFDLIVETSPEDDAELTQAGFDRLTGAGFYAYKVENDYSRNRFLSSSPTAPLCRSRRFPIACAISSIPAGACARRCGNAENA